MKAFRANLATAKSTKKGQLYKSPTGTELTYEQASKLKNEAVWKNLSDITVEQAAQEWLATLSAITAKNYLCGLKKLMQRKYLEKNSSLQLFALVNHNATIDKIKSARGWSECSRQARAACYISFTRFLSRRTQGIIPQAIPSKEGVSKTFYKVREKVATEAMTREEWSNFLEELEKINKRDCLIAKIILQGGKRINEVLTLTTDLIDFQKSEIRFKQSKTKGYEKQTIITYPKNIIEELRVYIGKRTGIVFVTKNNKPLMINQIATTFGKAGKRAGIDFKVTPHVLRASAITFFKLSGFSDSDIMKVSGHASSEMVNAYDKGDRAQNLTKKMSLV